MTTWRSLRQRVRELAADNRSGATALAERAAALLADAADLTPAAFERLALAVARAHPPMAPLLRLANHVLLAAEEHPDARGAAIRGAASSFAAALRAHAAEAARRAVSLAVGTRVLTHSASSLVADVLLRAHAAGGVSEVICTESRPAREGVELARRLGAAGMRVLLVTDAAAPALLSRCEVVLIGADAVGTGGLLHKVGTFGLALAARDLGVPVYALATDEKLLPAACGDVPPIPARDPAELLAPPAPGVRVCNRYYDRTPRALLSGILTEEGRRGDADIRARLRQIVVHPRLVRLWLRQPGTRLADRERE